MKKLFCSWCFFLAVSLPICFGQSLSYFTHGANSLGSGGASVAWDNPHAAISNPAGTLGVNRQAFQCSAQNKYGIRSYNIFAASYIQRFRKHQAFSISVKYNGDSDLNHQVLGLAYARKLTTNWQIAMQADLISFRTKAFGSKYLPSFELGSLLHLNKKLKLGLHIFNPLAQKINKKLYLSSVFRFGAYYEISDRVSVMAEVEKDVIQPYVIKAGLHYKPIKKLTIHGGYNSYGNQLALGLSYNFNNFGVHAASAFHQRIGLSHAGEISYTR